MNYKSISELNADILEWLTYIPKDIDIVIGIPRSGMLVANIIALYLNKPVADIDGFINGHVMGIGARNTFVQKTSYKRALVVDDSVLTGRALNEARAKLTTTCSDLTYIYAAPYIAQGGESAVDIYYQNLPIPRVFEWNLMHHSILPKACVDIDGILCRDPSDDENDDGPKYDEFLKTVSLKIRPSIEIGWLVTCRLEKYRDATMRWLAKHSIPYKSLIMMDLPDKASRLRLGNHAQFKARILKETNAELFIESSLGQATEIARISKKPVICFDTSQLIVPNDTYKLINDSRDIYQIFKGRIMSKLHRILNIISHQSPWHP